MNILILILGILAISCLTLFVADLALMLLNFILATFGSPNGRLYQLVVPRAKPIGTCLMNMMNIIFLLYLPLYIISVFL